MKRQALVRIRQVQEAMVVIDLADDQALDNDTLAENIRTAPVTLVLGDKVPEWSTSRPYVVGVSVEEVHPDDEF